LSYASVSFLEPRRRELRWDGRTMGNRPGTARPTRRESELLSPGSGPGQAIFVPGLPAATAAGNFVEQDPAATETFSEPAPPPSGSTRGDRRLPGQAPEPFPSEPRQIRRPRKGLIPRDSAAASAPKTQKPSSFAFAGTGSRCPRAILTRSSARRGLRGRLAETAECRSVRTTAAPAAGRSGESPRGSGSVTWSRKRTVRRRSSRRGSPPPRRSRGCDAGRDAVVRLPGQPVELLPRDGRRRLRLPGPLLDLRTRAPSPADNPEGLDRPGPPLQRLAHRVEAGDDHSGISTRTTTSAATPALGPKSVRPFPTRPSPRRSRPPSREARRSARAWRRGWGRSSAGGDHRHVDVHDAGAPRHLPTCATRRRRGASFHSGREVPKTVPSRRGGRAEEGVGQAWRTTSPSECPSGRHPTDLDPPGRSGGPARAGARRSRARSGGSSHPFGEARWPRPREVSG